MMQKQIQKLNFFVLLLGTFACASVEAVDNYTWGTDLSKQCSSLIAKRDKEQNPYVYYIGEIKSLFSNKRLLYVAHGDDIQESRTYVWEEFHKGGNKCREASLTDLSEAERQLIKRQSQNLIKMDQKMSVNLSLQKGESVSPKEREAWFRNRDPEKDVDFGPEDAMEGLSSDS